jgi:hypothetical protein
MAKNDSGYTLVGDYFIANDHLSNYDFSCEPVKCVEKGKCCCKFYDIDITGPEMMKIVGIFDTVSLFCEGLAKDGVYQNVFEKEGSRYLLDKQENGFCVFTYFDDDDNLRCAIHSAALKLKLDPSACKPLVCTLWPYHIVKKVNGVLYLSLETDEKFSCIKKIPSSPSRRR